MSELFMECVEEELEPWQKSVPQINLTEDDDDEPIFVGVVSNNKKELNSKNTSVQRKSEEKQEIVQPSSQPSTGPSQVMQTFSVAGEPGNTLTPTMPTITPQSIVVNNQGFIVAPQMTNNSNVLASLGGQYPFGTQFTLVPAPQHQQQVFQHISPATLMQGVIHRPQVQNISNNIVTLSNIQNPNVFNTQPRQILIKQANAPLPVMKQVPVKKILPFPQIDNSVKRPKIEIGYPNPVNIAQNGSSKYECINCKIVFSDEDGLKNHATSCKPTDVNSAAESQPPGGSKRIMLVGEFYYGKYEGDGYTKETEKVITFKCQCCLKVLKNNIRFMNHVKHHLELEKQNSESFESHTTCQHCYRQYLTPFQLQCHIESAHSAVESTTNCKICELAFETEQVLLDHMKNNHRPGEMPYVCQVCNFRSSFFSDVEAHFRNAHENAKDILCPFCLKVFKSGHIYMQHYMRHQKKGIFRCGKCRLNFLSFKEKVEHRTQVHRTFVKPKALEGLAPGTKVTIRASLSGNPITPSVPTPFGFIITSDKPQSSKSGNGQKSQVENSGHVKIKLNQRKQDGGTSKNNFFLKRTSGINLKCIECKGLINDLSHFPMILNCGACKYQTNCKESIGNHMIRFHSTINKSRFLKCENRRCFSPLKSTLVCLKCDLFLDASSGDRMAKHLIDRPRHRCKVILEKDLAAVKAKDQALPDEKLNGSSSSSTITNPENDEDFSNTGLTAAADSTEDPPEPSIKSVSSGCEQENGSLDIVSDRDSEESLNPDLNVAAEVVSDQGEMMTS